MRQRLVVVIVTVIAVLVAVPAAAKISPGADSVTTAQAAKKTKEKSRKKCKRGYTLVRKNGKAWCKKKRRPKPKPNDEDDFYTGDGDEDPSPQQGNKPSGGGGTTKPQPKFPPDPPAPPTEPAPPPGTLVTDGQKAVTQCGTGTNAYGIRFSGSGTGRAIQHDQRQTLTVTFGQGTGNWVTWRIAGPGSLYVEGCNGVYVPPRNGKAYVGADGQVRSLTAEIYAQTGNTTESGGSGGSGTSEGGPTNVDSTNFKFTVYPPPGTNGRLCDNEYLSVYLRSSLDYFYISDGRPWEGAFYGRRTFQPIIPPGHWNVYIFYASGAEKMTSVYVGECTGKFVSG